METLSEQEEAALRQQKHQEGVQALVDLADHPPQDPQKLELFLRVRTILAMVRPELDGVFQGLFENGRHERDARTFLGRLREVVSGTDLTWADKRILEEASHVSGFSIIQTLVDDKVDEKMFPKNKLPVTERVIRTIPVPPVSSTGSTSFRCGNEAILEIRA